MGRKSAPVILLNEHRCTMNDSWVNRIEVTRFPGCKFSVTGSKARGLPTLDHRGALPITRADDITSPRALYRALNDTVVMLDAELEWVDVIPLIARLDWITAAVIASDVGHDVPDLPSFKVLVSQRSLTSIRRMSKVTIGAEWGYDMHELTMSFEQWLRILGGQGHRVEKPYLYEGKRHLGVWMFDGKGGLVVGIDYEGEGWGGCLVDLELLEGPRVEDTDIAKLAAQASRAT
jgi:hypothetical protein